GIDGVQVSLAAVVQDGHARRSRRDPPLDTIHRRQDPSRRSTGEDGLGGDQAAASDDAIAVRDADALVGQVGAKELRAPGGARPREGVGGGPAPQIPRSRRPRPEGSGWAWCFFCRPRPPRGAARPCRGPKKNTPPATSAPRRSRAWSSGSAPPRWTRWRTG